MFLPFSDTVYADFPCASAGNDKVADVQRTVLYEDGCKRSFAFVKFRLDNAAFCGAVRVCFQFQNIGHEKYRFQKFVHAFSRFRADVYDGSRAAPRFGNEIVFGELLQNSFGLCARFVDFVYGDDNRNAGGFRVVDCLDRLRHNAVVCCNDDDRDVRNERAS